MSKTGLKYTQINESVSYQEYSDNISEMYKLDKNSRRDSEKLQWLSTYQSVQERILGGNIVKESYGSQSPEVIPGMNAVTFPSNPGNGVGAKDGAFFQPDYVRGSGDIPAAQLAFSMNVAAYTIGLELLPVLPMDLPSMQFSYVDTIYAGGELDNAEQPPIYIEISGGTIGTQPFDYSKFAKGDVLNFIQYDSTLTAYVAGGVAIQTKYVQKHRLTGNLIVAVGTVGTVDGTGAYTETVPAVSIADAVTSAFVGASDAWGVDIDGVGVIGDVELVGTAIKADFVSTSDTFIEEFSNPNTVLDANGSAERISATRAEGENGTENAIGLRIFSTAVEAGKVQTIGNLTIEQEEDLGAYGHNPNEMLYKALQNESTQAINKDILRTLFRLGVTSHAQLRTAQDFDLNLYIAPTTSASENLANFGVGEFVDMLGNDRTGDFTAIPNAETNSSAENTWTRGRRIASRILGASNMISTVGREGMGNFAVVNTQIASALIDGKEFPQTQYENSLSNQTKNLYYIGDIQGGISVYCDPNMKYSDTRILVGRKGTAGDPGLKFFAYRLSQLRETVSETSMSRKMLVYSRYKLVPVGFYPEAQYITFAVHSDFGMWI